MKRIYHGECKTNLYKRWILMRWRCSKNNKDESHLNIYFRRGIKVCQQWDNFLNFKKWAIENSFSEEKIMDRIDNEKGYHPSNCRWVLTKKSIENRRNTRWVVFNGKKKLLLDVASACKIHPSTIEERLDRGIPIEKAVIKGRGPNKHPFCKRGHDLRIEGNLYLRKDRPGCGECLVCIKLRRSK